MDRMVLERPDESGIDHVLTVIDRGIGDLGERVVETRRPLSGAQPRRGRAVVDHVGNAAGMHVGVERVDGSMIDSLAISE